VPWLYNSDSRIFISYDDPESIAAKAEYVRREGYGGIMFWELGGDDGSLLRAIHRGLGLRTP
jgi:chitinase